MTFFMKKTLAIVVLTVFSSSHISVHAAGGSEVVGQAHKGHSHVQVKKLHDSQIKAAQLKAPEVYRKHLGKAESVYTKRYQFFVNLNEIGSWPAYKSSSEVGENMTSEQLDMLWEYIAYDLPAGIDFSIRKATIEKGNLSTVYVYLEESAAESNIPKSNLITGAYPILNSGYVELVPGLHEYADFEKWDKETGFSEARKHLLEKDKIILVSFAIKEIVQDGEPDLEGYKRTLERVGIHVPIRDLIVLADGSRATEVYTDIDRLNSLYNEKSIVNIIPDLSGSE